MNEWMNMWFKGFTYWCNHMQNMVSLNMNWRRRLLLADFSDRGRICDLTQQSVTHLTDLLQRRHPGWRKVTVLEQHPCSLLDSLLDHPDGDGSLTLTQGQRVKLGASETLQTVSHMIPEQFPWWFTLTNDFKSLFLRIGVGEVVGKLKRRMRSGIKSSLMTLSKPHQDLPRQVEVRSKEGRLDWLNSVRFG